MKTEVQNAINEFLSKKRIALVGHTWQRDDAAWHVFRKLTRLGYEVVPVGPAGGTIDGTPFMPDLGSVSGEIGGVLCTGSGEVSTRVVQAAADRGVRLVWLHSSLGTSPRRWMRKREWKISSVSREACDLARNRGVTLIPGGCPMMFREPVDIPHRLVRTVLDKIGCFNEREFD